MYSWMNLSVWNVFNTVTLLYIFKHEATFESYKRHMVRQAGPAPLTMAEEELEMIKKSEV